MLLSVTIKGIWHAGSGFPIIVMERESVQMSVNIAMHLCWWYCKTSRSVLVLQQNIYQDKESMINIGFLCLTSICTRFLRVTR